MTTNLPTTLLSLELLRLNAHRAASSKFAEHSQRFQKRKIAVFKNMLSMSKAAQVDDWWDSLTFEEQHAYIESHPHTTKTITKTVQPIKLKDLGKAIKAVVMRRKQTAKKKILAAVLKKRRMARKCAVAVNKFRYGQELAPAEKTALKTAAKIVAVGLIASLVAVALFTPLMPFAPLIASEFLSSYSSSESNSSLSTLNENNSIESESFGFLTDEFANWLVQRDPTDLERYFKEKSLPTT